MEIGISMFGDQHIDPQGNIQPTSQRLQELIEEIKLMDTLLNQAADHSADLMAIGAFDHAGIAFFGRGSGTRYILRHMTLPVLFAH